MNPGDMYQPQGTHVRTHDSYAYQDTGPWVHEGAHVRPMPDGRGLRSALLPRYILDTSAGIAAMFPYVRTDMTSDLCDQRSWVAPREWAARRGSHRLTGGTRFGCGLELAVPSLNERLDDGACILQRGENLVSGRAGRISDRGMSEVMFGSVGEPLE